MARLLNLLTVENVAYAERARTLTSTVLQYQPQRIFEVMEPGLRARATYQPAYGDNLFLCEHPGEAGWSIITVDAPIDYRGVPQSMSFLATEKRRDLLFEAWLEHRTAPQPLAVLFDDAARVVAGERFRTFEMVVDEAVPVLLMLRAVGADGDALRALYALGRWPEVADFADGEDLLRVEVDGLSRLPGEEISPS